MSRKYLILILCSLTSLTIGSVLNVMHGYLPYKVWLPYNSNISLIFWLTSMQQMITIFFGTFINIGTETLIFGFMLQTCAQIEIFQSRLKKLVICKRTRYAKHSLASSDKKEATISEYVRHHLSIYKLVESFYIYCTFLSIYIFKRSHVLVRIPVFVSYMYIF